MRFQPAASPGVYIHRISINVDLFSGRSLSPCLAGVAVPCEGEGVSASPQARRPPRDDQLTGVEHRNYKEGADNTAKRLSLLARRPVAREGLALAREGRARGVRARVVFQGGLDPAMPDTVSAARPGHVGQTE